MLTSVDNLDALKAQRTRVSTSDTRDPGWTAPSDAFLRLTCRWRSFAPAEGSEADRCRDQLRSLPRETCRMQRERSTRPLVSPVDIALYRVDGKARR